MLISDPVDEMRGIWQLIYGDASANCLALDVYENHDHYIATVALPNGQVDNVKLHDDLLTVEGQIPEQIVENIDSLISERVKDRFNCTVRFPKPVNRYEVEATFKNGVLTVILPKTKEAQRHPILVKAGDNGKKR